MSDATFWKSVQELADKADPRKHAIVMHPADWYDLGKTVGCEIANDTDPIFLSDPVFHIGEVRVELRNSAERGHPVLWTFRTFSPDGGDM